MIHYPQCGNGSDSHTPTIAGSLLGVPHQPQKMDHWLIENQTQQFGKFPRLSFLLKYHHFKTNPHIMDASEVGHIPKSTPIVAVWVVVWGGNHWFQRGFSIIHAHPRSPKYVSPQSTRIHRCDSHHQNFVKRQEPRLFGHFDKDGDGKIASRLQEALMVFQ